jgi:hypothetical protein
VLWLFPCAKYRGFQAVTKFAAKAAFTKKKRENMIQPTTPNLAKLKYPTAIKKAQAEVDRFSSAWVEEDTIREELKTQLDESQVKDAVAFKEAAIAGDPIPDEANTHSIEKMLAYQNVRAHHAKSQCDNASRKLVSLVKENKEAVIALAIGKARNGVEAWKADVDNIAIRQIEATKARSETLDGVRMLAYLDLTACKSTLMMC